MVAPSSFDTLPPDLAPCASAQVAGLHRAVPSTTLDKAIQLSAPHYISVRPLLSRGQVANPPKNMQVLRGQLRSRFSILNNENILNPGHFNVFF